MDTVFLTGATGLLGNEILRALLRQDLNTTILVLVRGEPRTSGPKFQNLVDDPLRSEFVRRVEPVWADLEKEGLGLSAQTREGLTERITHVIHSAAAVDFALPYAVARAANFDGTVRLIELVKRSRNLKAFAHISTAHVAGRRTGFVAEEELEHCCGFVNFYEQTKYETERFLRERMDELPISVYRSTTLIGDSRTGAVRQFNFFHNAIRLYYHSLIPAIPGDPLGHLDLIPVDWAAQAIRFLVMQNFHLATTYHVCAEPPRSYNLQQLIDATLDAFESSPHSTRHGIQKPSIVTPNQFDVMIREAQEESRAKILQLLKPFSYFLPHLVLPKVFGADNLHRDLPALSEQAAPDVREYYPKVVDFCLKTGWGRS
jgi:thioester reductase-like protein